MKLHLIRHDNPFAGKGWFVGYSERTDEIRKALELLHERTGHTNVLLDVTINSRECLPGIPEGIVTGDVEDIQAIWDQYPDSESVLATGDPWKIAAWFRAEASRLARALQLKSDGAPLDPISMFVTLASMTVKGEELAEWAELRADDAGRLARAIREGNLWRCFHCGDVFTDAAEAREHFGDTMDDEPICQVTAERYRAVERELVAYQNESDATSRTFYDIGHRAAVAERDAEQKGYDRGIADAKAHPHQLGLVKAENRNQTPERVQELMEANNKLLERARAAEGGKP